MKEKILIIGGSGYLGTNLLNDLSIDGSYELFLLRFRNKNPDPLPYQYSYLDIDDYDSIQKIRTNIDYVIHLAGKSSEKLNENPLRNFSESLNTNLSLSKIISNSNIKKLIYISSVHVYGGSLTGIVDESKIARPDTNYGLAHLIAEKIFLSCNSSLTDVFILRVSNVFGSSVNFSKTLWNLIGNNFAKQVIESGSIEISSRTDFKRDFLPISNFLQAIRNIIENRNIRGSIYNIGMGKTMSIIDLAKVFSERGGVLFNKMVPLETPEMSSFDVEDFTYNVNRFSQLANFNISNIESEVDRLLLFTKNRN